MFKNDSDRGFPRVLGLSREKLGMNK